MENRSSGMRLYLQQSRALLVKNVLLSWRNLTATLLQLSASFIFIFLIWAVGEAIDARNSATGFFKNLTDPPSTAVPAIPLCEDGFYIKAPCYDLLWSGNQSSVITDLVNNITLNNPGRPIPKEKVLGFATAEAVDAWLLENPYRSFGALHFRETELGLGYGIQVNTTAKQVRGVYEKTVFKFQLPLQVAAERELARYLAQDWSIEWTPSTAEYSHPPIDTFSAVGSVGPTFLFAAALFGFVNLIGNVVLERELKLRQAMTTMGLLDSAYWTTWFLWETLLALVSSLLLVLFGMIFQFSFFLDNNFLILLLMFFLFQVCMVAFAFFLSTFVSKSGTSTNLGFLVFLIGFASQLVVAFGFPYSSDLDDDKNEKSSIRLKGKTSNNIFTFRIIFSLFPPNLLAIGLQYLGDATASSNDNGFKLSQIAECSVQDPDCVFTMADIFIWLTVLTIVYALIALYLDNVLPDVNGIRKSLFFFAYPSFWFGNIPAKEGGKCCQCLGRVPPVPPPDSPEDEDVVEERNALQSGLKGGSNIALELHGLVKSFAGGTEVRCCCRCVRNKPFHAIKGSWFTVEENTLFCLLGPNGAGKSTTINCLTGVIPITSGEGYIYGNSVKIPSDMSRIRSFMGVCPQFDILWPALNGREHLRLFANIKGLNPAYIAEEVDRLLKQVNLEEAGGVRSGSYSGGMKRRLSVAIALIGDPKIIFLDEPTTGMDPITRRSVWDVIEAAKKGRAIVLTTHSMEEADILGDRIAIMAKGRLRCLGTSLRLKSKFGEGYIINVSVRTSNDVGAEAEVETRAANVKDFFLKNLEIEPVEETNAYIKFVVPRFKEEMLSEFFLLLRKKKEELGITDLQLSLTTLEEVFLNIARAAELESSDSGPRYEAITLLNGMEIKVPIGAQYVAVPEVLGLPQGMVVGVMWQQDEGGNLRIVQHSEPIAPPPSVRPQDILQAGPITHQASRRARGAREPSAVVVQ